MNIHLSLFYIHYTSLQFGALNLTIPFTMQCESVCVLRCPKRHSPCSRITCSNDENHINRHYTQLLLSDMDPWRDFRVAPTTLPDTETCLLAVSAEKKVT